jgi:hypothetical protein
LSEAFNIVAPRAARQGDPIVKAFVHDFLPLFFKRRRFLRAPYSERGDFLLPALPEFLKQRRFDKHGKELARPQRRKKGDESPAIPRGDLDWRRADGMAVICRVWSVLIACCDWISKEVLEPNRTKGNGSLYLSVARIAEEAECSDAQAWRALYWLKSARQITFTHQFREELADGTHRSTGAALRRLSMASLEKVPCMRRVIHHRTGKLKDRHDKHDRKRAARGLGRDVIRQQEKTTPDVEPAATWAPKSIAPLSVTDEIAKTHPEWDAGQVLAEARRREQST